MFAGSVLDLEPDTSYEARFVISDPDGVRGPSERIVTVRTRAEPQAYAGGRVFHVYPHGFKGQTVEPSFEGLMCAYNYTCAGTDWATAGRPRVKAGDTILVHAAAGGVGLILCQWANALGATVIGTVSTDEKAELARAHGCDHPIVYTRQDFVAEVDRITKGAKLPVVYDSVGKDTFVKSLDCLRPRGIMVSYGNSSGPVDPFPPGILAQKGSLFLTRPTLYNYTASRPELEAAASELFDVVASGKVKIEVKQRFALKDAAEAHRALEGRKTTGSTILTV